MLYLNVIIGFIDYSVRFTMNDIVKMMTSHSSKSGKRVSLITLSGPTHKNDENTPAVKADTTQPQVNGHPQV